MSSEKALHLYQLIANLHIPFGLERSIKLTHRALLDRRFLLSLSKKAIGPQADSAILDICRRLDIPDGYLAGVREHLAEANMVHFGFEEDANACLYKVYLEFQRRFVTTIRAHPQQADPLLLHIAFKWDACDPGRQVIAHYTCYPCLTHPQIMERVAALYRGYHEARPQVFARTLLEYAARRFDRDDMLYLEVQEEHNPRRSFDVNLYKAHLVLRELSPLLAEMCRYYGIPAAAWQACYAPVSMKTFGHLSGGISRDGTDFFTLYFGVEGHTG